MQIPRLIVHEYLKGLGIPGLAGLAMLLVALVWALGGLMPDWSSLQSLSQQTREAGEYLARVEDGSITAPVVPQRQLDDFRSKLPSQPQATVAIDKIYALAAQERITLARGEYSLGIDPKTHLARYQILLPVRGTYPQLRRFLHALLGQLPAVVVEDVEFQRKKIADTDLTGRIRMTLYLSRS
ncbi:GspMb/PilO family protein [Pseudomonas sp. ANT_H12B]|uniref:GspMb/PilO family protein n=1 Tax=Pseudomonas sp. ANT_H12B TaxID=2597348 RepID=UPI0011EFFC96|nr:GspMb/PilO family protein [Pseudomonas sp. ANT_H12B]KAA0959336.1 pilus assembly protein PilO [Pseudomonas sp. ANT_H12B]